MFHTKCPKCIVYIQDTLMQPLLETHQLKENILLHKLYPLLPELANAMETFIKSYIGHKNLAPRLQRDTLQIKKYLEPDDYYRIYTGILRWYKDLYSYNKSNRLKHPFQTDMETLAILAIELGAIRTFQVECPIKVFTQWFMEQYLFFLTCLDQIHDEHEDKHTTKKTSVKSASLETKWDRSDLDSIYD